jgi:hypothetical protein
MQVAEFRYEYAIAKRSRNGEVVLFVEVALKASLGALLSRQTANKDYQSSHIILGEFLSECRHFAFNPV